MLRLNIGSGQRRFDGRWTNCDLLYDRKGNEPDVACDGAQLPFPDSSAEYVVLHHVLEHFGCGEGDALIRESRRVLADGGSLLVFVPDMKALAHAWLESKPIRMDAQLYMTNVYGAYQGNEADRHKWGYDMVSLQTMLWRNGPWRRVCPFDWRAIEDADIAHDWWILGMEAVK